MDNPLAELINAHLRQRGWSVARLARSAGIPRNTAHQWAKGRVRRVHQWQHVANAARVLELSRDEANQLLTAAGWDSLEVIAHQTREAQDLELLGHWPPPSPDDPARPANNLPHPLTSFVGRAEEQAQIIRLLTSTSARIVTLTGTGGSGKTRLAIETAFAVQDRFDEVWFVDLAPLHDAGQVIPAIARTIGLRETAERTVQQAVEQHLRDRKALLVLDNFEQVQSAGSSVAHMLGVAGRVSVLVTSRIRLNIRGEHVFAVAPLPLASRSAGFEELQSNSAVILFADRASAAEHTFSLTPLHAPLIAGICARLDGLPLGIELVAAHARSMSLQEMLKRFTGRLALESDGPRDMPDRQRTLRATIAWSYDLLGHDEQRLMTCAGVFAGGFTEEAIRAVHAAGAWGARNVAADLEMLVEHNLLRWTAGTHDPPRYELLETIREYALERLQADGQEEATRRDVARYFLGLAERAELEGKSQTMWVDRLDREYENFRAVLDWCIGHGEETELGLRLCIALMPLWRLRDYPMDARRWLEAFLAAGADVDPGLRARGLLWQGLLVMRTTGDQARASTTIAEAMRLFDEGGDLHGVIETLQAEGDLLRDQQAWAEAQRRYAEGLRLAEETGNARLIAHGWMGLALCAQEEGEIDEAQRHWERTREWAVRAQDEPTEALALNGLGEMARHRGDWTEAERAYERTLDIARELDNEWRIALALHNLGYVALSRGEPARAEGLFAESLTLYEQRHYHKGVAECLAGLGKMEATRGNHNRAARLCGAAVGILARLGTRLDAVDRADYETTLDLLYIQLGDRLNVLLADGRAMRIKEAVEYALSEDREKP